MSFESHSLDLNGQIMECEHCNLSTPRVYDSRTLPQDLKAHRNQMAIGSISALVLVAFPPTISRVSTNTIFSVLAYFCETRDMSQIMLA